jgi:hypothetical protein
MRDRVTIITRIATLAAVLLGASICARGQSVWGYSFVYYDPEYDWTSGVGVTYPDYSTQYYYDPKVHLTLTGTDGFFDDFYCAYPTPCNLGDYAWAGLGVQPPTPGATYTVTAYHYVDVYYRYYDIDSGCMYSCSDWYDAFGYSFDLCSPECQADPMCYCVTRVGLPSDWYWYPPLITALVYIAEQYLGESSDEMTMPCGIPTNFRQTSWSATGGTLNFEYTWDSSTGNLADLRGCKLGEYVLYRADELSSASPPFPWITSQYRNPTESYPRDGPDGSFPDSHATPSDPATPTVTNPNGFVKPYSTKSITATQWYRFTCPCYNGGNFVNLLGPLEIVRSVDTNSDGTWHFVITKSGVSARIDALP